MIARHAEESESKRQCDLLRGIVGERDAVAERLPEAERGGRDVVTAAVIGRESQADVAQIERVRLNHQVAGVLDHDDLAHIRGGLNVNRLRRHATVSHAGAVSHRLSRCRHRSSWSSGLFLGHPATRPR